MSGACRLWSRTQEAGLGQWLLDRSKGRGAYRRPTSRTCREFASSGCGGHAPGSRRIYRVHARWSQGARPGRPVNLPCLFNRYRRRRSPGGEVSPGRQARRAAAHGLASGRRGQLKQYDMYVAGTEARGADEFVDVDGAPSKRAHDALGLVLADIGQGLGWRFRLRRRARRARAAVPELARALPRCRGRR